MTKEEDFKLLKIQTCILKVNIHCDGCKQKVKKLLQRIEGVFQVNIDAEQQKVTVSGSVDSATLIKKLVRAGKHAEIWSSKSNQNQKQNNNCIKDDKKNKGQKQGLIKGFEALNNHQQKLSAFSSEEDYDYYDDEEDEDEEDELSFLRGNNLGLLRQQAMDVNKKNIGAIAAASNNGGNKMNNHAGNGNTAGKKGGNQSHPNQNIGMKVNHPGGIDQKTMAALKMNNAAAQLGGGGNISTIGDGGKRGNDLSTMMNLAGFHGNGPNLSNAAAVLGGNPNNLGGFQTHHQLNNGYHGSSAAAGFPNGGYATGQYPSSMLMNMSGYNHPASMMMNRQVLQQQQPQMMYQRSPYMQPSTGYYYGYNSAPYPYFEQPNYNGGDQSSAAATTHMFSDENTSGCSIM